jgi:hypothetical protein
VDWLVLTELCTTTRSNEYLVFNRCAESLEEGRRLENLSWRIWNRETFCCELKPRFPDTPTSQTPTPRPLSRKSMPELSASVDSISSEDDEQTSETTGNSPPVHIKALSSGKCSVESFSSSRGRAKPISSYTLERMVMSIKETKINQKHDMTYLPTSITEALPIISIQLDPTPNQLQLSSAQEISPRRHSNQRFSQSFTSTAPTGSSISGVLRSQTLESDTSADLISHSVVRGFEPTKVSSSYRSPSSTMSTHSPLPIRSAIQPEDAKFMLGGSSDDESSFDDHRSFRPSQSSPFAALKTSQAKKVTSFKEEVDTRTIAEQVKMQPNEGAIDSTDDEDEDALDDDDDDDDDVSESAIEDGDDWEEYEASDAEPPSEKEQSLPFQRINSKPNLVSRRSLLTTGLHESQRAAALQLQASKSQPALQRLRSQKGKSTQAQEDSLEMQNSGIPRSKPISMTIPTSSAHNALSPRTTRRQMLATELTESLRKHLLWERQQKNTTANAVLRRRHTAHENMVNLKQYPSGGSGAGSKTNSWNAYFDHGLGEYNSRGW